MRNVNDDVCKCYGDVFVLDFQQRLQSPKENGKREVIVLCGAGFEQACQSRGCQIPALLQTVKE